MELISIKANRKQTVNVAYSTLSLGALQTLLSQRQATDFQSIHRWPAAIDVQMGWHDAAAWDTTLKNTTRKRHGMIGLVSVPARTRYSVVCGPNPQHAVPARTRHR